MIDIETWVNIHTLSRIIMYGTVTAGTELIDSQFITGPSINNTPRMCFKKIQWGGKIQWGLLTRNAST